MMRGGLRRRRLREERIVLAGRGFRSGRRPSPGFRPGWLVSSSWGRGGLAPGGGCRYRVGSLGGGVCVSSRCALVEGVGLGR